MKRWKWEIPTILLGIAVILNLVGRCWQGFTDYYVNHIFPFWVESYGRFTGLFSFSVGEWLLYLAALLAAVWAVWSVFALLRCLYLRRQAVSEGEKQRQKQKAYRCYSLFLYWVLGIVSMIMTLNCFLLYQSSVITERIPIGAGTKAAYGYEELVVLRDYVVEQANALSLEFDRNDQGYLQYCVQKKGAKTHQSQDQAVVLTREEFKALEVEAVKQMQRLGSRFQSLRGYYPHPKGLAVSGFFSQQYMMGYYFPFSMEANYNRQMYVTNMPVTMCHELSHLKGFIREDEANFLGYLACVDAEDKLFRYSAYLSVVGYLDRDFQRAIGMDKEIYFSHPQINDLVHADRRFLTPEAWEAVEQNAILNTETVKQATDTFLETTLTLNGVEDGTVSYSRVVALLLQYYDGILY